MRSTFNIADTTTLTMVDATAGDRLELGGLMDPYTEISGGKPAEIQGVRLSRRAVTAASMLDIQGDAGDGRVTGWDGARLHLLRDNSSGSVTGTGDWRDVHLHGDFPLWQAAQIFAGPLLQLNLAVHGAVCIHAAAVTYQGKGIAIAGWSESGKTETALALLERGARFVSDKWVVITADGVAHAFPGRVGIRAWTLPYLPRLRDAVGDRVRVRRRLAQGIRAVAAGGAGRAVGSPALSLGFGAMARTAGLVERVSWGPTALRAAYEQGPTEGLNAPLHAVALLRTTHQPSQVAPLPLETAVRRLVETAAFERRGLYELDRRLRYASEGGLGPLMSLRDVERKTLGRLLADVELLEVEADFPTDPGPVADRLLAAL